MYCVVSLGMDTDMKHRLALTGDADETAAGIRLKAARKCAGLSQEKLGELNSTGKAAVANAEKGRSFPSRPLMKYFFREHRIDFNFFVDGQFAQLPGDVQDQLFEKLKAIHNELDQEAS